MGFKQHLRILVDHVCNTHQFQLPSNILSAPRADTALSDTPLTAVSGLPGSLQVNKLPRHLQTAIVQFLPSVHLLVHYISTNRPINSLRMVTAGLTF